MLSMDEKPLASLSVEIDKELLLKFKSLCVLKEHTMSEEIEKMISDWVSINQEPGSPAEGKAPEEATKPSAEGSDISDEIEDSAEKA